MFYVTMSTHVICYSDLYSLSVVWTDNHDNNKQWHWQDLLFAIFVFQTIKYSEPLQMSSSTSNESE